MTNAELMEYGLNLEILCGPLDIERSTVGTIAERHEWLKKLKHRITEVESLFDNDAERLHAHYADTAIYSMPDFNRTITRKDKLLELIRNIE